MSDKKKMKATHNVVQTRGTYTDSEGNTKTKYQILGVGFSEEGSKEVKSIKFDALPIPNKDGEVYLNLYEIKEKN